MMDTLVSLQSGYSAGSSCGEQNDSSDQHIPSKVHAHQPEKFSR